MSIVAKLTISFIRQHPLRWVLTSIAIICAACMVIWVVSGYDALMKQFGEFSASSLGRYALTVQIVRLPGRPVVIRRPGEDTSIPTAIINELQTDPRVESIDPMWSVRTNVRSPKQEAEAATQAASATQTATTQSARSPGMGRGGGVTMMGINSPVPPFPMLRGEWIDAKNKPEALVGCLSVGAARRMGVDVGDDVLAGTQDNPTTVKVIGIVNVPDISAGRGPGSARNPGTGGLYVPMLLAEDIVDRDWEASFACITFKPGTDINAFRFKWQPRLATMAVPLQFQNAKELEEALDESATAENMRMQAYSATGISLLASLFIIFSTLSMGVNERARQLAVLRAVALTRAQIAMLIFGESLLMAIIGWAGGLVAGWGLLHFLQHSDPDLLGNAMLGKWSVALSGICAFGGSMLAAIAPAIRATRVRPIDAMAPATAVSTRRLSIGTLALGLLLISINPLLVYVIPQSDDARYAIYMALGCTTMAIGFMMLAPATVVLTDRLIGPVIARLMGLDPRLLAQQLSSNRWRTVGTAVALTIGLGLFISMQVWGYTMLEPFEPGPWVPDVMLGFPPGGIPPAAADAIAKMPGVDPNRCLPMAVEQPTLVGDITGSAQRATVTREDNVVMIGMDAARAFTGPTPLLKPDFVAGDAESAVKLMKQGRYCIVPDHFCRETKLGIGGKFKVQLATGGEMFEYTIAGVVRLPGWHWMSKYSGLRMNENRSAAMVFANYNDVADDFQLNRVRFMWMDTTVPIDPQTFAQQVCDVVNPIFTKFIPTLSTAPLLSGKPSNWLAGRPGGNSPAGMPSGNGFAGRRSPADASGGAPRVQFVPAELRNGVISLILPGTDSSPTVHVATRLAVLERIRTHAAQMIWAMSQLPLVTLAVTSIGMLNTILASVRARRWDMGVLRAVGFSRWTLVRLILAEAILVGIVAMILSLSFGTMAGWCGAGISQYVSFFGGLRPSLVIPWSHVSIGLGATLLICLLAALVPAILTGRTDVLKLLQAGRSTT